MTSLDDAPRLFAKLDFRQPDDALVTLVAWFKLDADADDFCRPYAAVRHRSPNGPDSNRG